MDDQGNVQMTETIYTAGAPARIILEADREQYSSDGEDLCYVIAKIVDAQGNLCPLADTLLTFAAEGCGELIATDNGCQTDLVPFPSPERNAYNGYAVGIFQTKEGESGELHVRVTAEGLPSEELQIIVK